MRLPTEWHGGWPARHVARHKEALGDLMPQTCRVCLGQWPAADPWIADCGLTAASLHKDQFFRGWTVVAPTRPAMELFELFREGSGQFIQKVSTVAQSLAAAFKPVKPNSELLGNRLFPSSLAHHSETGRRSGPAGSSLDRPARRGPTPGDGAPRTHPAYPGTAPLMGGT